MPIYQTYASRVAAAAKAGMPDVYTYDKLPLFLKTQIAQIFKECIGPGWDNREWDGKTWDLDFPPQNANEEWEDIASILDQEIEAFRRPRVDVYAYGHCRHFLRTSSNINEVLSLIELCAQVMLKLAETNPLGGPGRGATGNPHEGVAELNQRFLQHSVGYQFENGEIIRIDSQYVHSEVVKEALRLLCEPEFKEANDEFMKAHRYLREGGGSLRDCNTSALRAMENTLKVICDATGWTYQKGDTVERLLAIVQREGLFPEYLLEDGYFRNLIGAMKAGVPKIRDRQGGHGAAPGDKPVPDHIGAFALHLTAANIVMLVKAYRALPS